jgi:hypothetical protein
MKTQVFVSKQIFNIKQIETMEKARFLRQASFWKDIGKKIVLCFNSKANCISNPLM